MQSRWKARNASGLLISLGLLLILVAAADTIAVVRRARSLCDGGSNTGFIRLFFPGDESANCRAALVSVTPRPAVNSQNLIVTPAVWPTARPVLEPEPVSTATVSPTTAPPGGQATGVVESRSIETPIPIWTPQRIVIPAIQLDAPVVAVGHQEIEYGQKKYRQWSVPDTFAAGWHQTTASLGAPGNTVLNGHHNFHGEVFRHLADLQVGDRIVVYSGETAFAYAIALKMILPERDQPLEARVANARWIQPSQDERLTLVTCWPYYNNTHRVIVMAIPVRLPENTAEVQPLFPGQSPPATETVPRPTSTASG